MLIEQVEQVREEDAYAVTDCHAILRRGIEEPDGGCAVEYDAEDVGAVDAGESVELDDPCHGKDGEQEPQSPHHGE